jgi:hypothetical protein
LSVVKKKKAPLSAFASGYAGTYIPGHMPGQNLLATFDHSDIRGLVTGKTCLRRGAASVFKREFGKPYPQRLNEDSPYVVLSPHMLWNFVTASWFLRYGFQVFASSHACP